MSLYDVKKSIRKCNFLLDFQKDKIVEMLEEDGTIPQEREDYIKLVDCVLRKLLDMSVEDLKPSERALLEQAVGDYYVG